MRSSDYANTLYNDYVDAVEKYEVLEHKYRQLKKENNNIKYRINNESNLKKEVKELKETIAELNKKIKEQNDLIDKQNLEIQRLKNQINKDSTNSSKSPSTDSPNKPKKIYNNREKTDRKPGGQFGHKGKTLTNEEIKKLIDENKVEHRIVEVSKEEFKVKYVVDVEVTTVVTEYVVKDENENIIEIKKPGNPVIYGNEIKAITSLLFNQAKVSTDNIVSFVNDVTDGVISISKGTVINWQNELKQNLEPELENIKQELLNSDILHVDSALVNVNGENHFVHNVSDDTHTYQTIHDNKGLDAIKEQGLLALFLGILIHDHFTGYYQFGIFNAECLIHVIRYLKAVVEFAKHSWAQKMIDLLYEMKKHKEELITQGINSMPDKEIEIYKQRYRDIIALGRTENEDTSMINAYSNDERKIINRLENYEENHLLFIVNFKVPFTNNRSELDQRHVKSKQNTGIFRSSGGANTYVQISSCISTYRKQDINVFNAIKKAYEGNPIII